MFSNTYPVHYCGIDRNKVHPKLIETHLFRFKTPNKHTYIVRAERFPDQTFAIKFFLKAHRLSDNKYNLTTGFGNATPIFATCLSIMVTIYRKFPNASFVIVGANSLDEVDSNTQRFRIYRVLMGRFFRPETFEHREYSKKSVYVLANMVRLSVDPFLIQKVINLLKQAKVL